MADPNNSLQNLQGKSWELYAESLGYDKYSDFSEAVEAPGNQRRPCSSTRLKIEDRHLYGVRLGFEDFYTVVCELCGKLVKPQAMLRHVEIHHGGANEEYFNEIKVRQERKRAQKPKTGRNKNAVKMERRMDVSETYRDHIPQQPIVNSNSLNGHSSADFKSFTEQECNSNSQSSLDSKNYVDMNFLCGKSELDPLLKTQTKVDSPEFSNHIQQSYLASAMQVETPQTYQPSPSPSSLHQMQHNHNQIVQALASPMMSMSPLSQNLAPSTPGMGRPPTPGMGRPPTPGMGRPPTPGMGQPLTPGLGNPSTPNMGPPTPIMAPLTPGITPNTPGSQNMGMCTMVPTPSPKMIHQAQSPAPSLSPFAQAPSPAQPMGSNFHQSSNVFQGTSNQQFNQLLQGQPQKVTQTSILTNVLQNMEVPSQNGSTGVYGIPAPRIQVAQNPQMMRNSGPQTMRERESRPLSRHDEEEVQKIREMLIKETEGMMTNDTNELHRSGIRNCQPVEVQNMPGASINQARNSYLNTNLSVEPQDVRQPLRSAPQASTVPVPMNPMLAAQIQQIQDALLETVSESDLNAVLNATPDGAITANSLANSTGQVKFSENPALSQRATSLYENNAMTVQGALDDILIANNPAQKSHVHQKQFSNADNGTNNSSLIFNVDKSSETDELTRAVNSITQIYPTDNFAVLSSHQSQSSGSNMSGFSQTATQSSLPMTNANRGVTVVFADPNQSSQMLTVNSRRMSVPGTSATHQQLQDGSNTNSILQRNLSADYIRKEARNFSPDVIHGTIDQERVQIGSQNATKVQQVQVSPQIQMTQQKFSQASPVPQTFSNSATPVTSVPPPSVSPRRTGKRKRPERKFVPLKDREYDPEIHCGVVDSETGTSCTRSLTCKTHTLTMRRNVQGRSRKFDELLNQHKASKGKQTNPQKATSKPVEQVSSTVYSNAQQRTPVVGSYTTGTSHTMSQYNTTTPIFVRTLAGTSATPGATIPDPSPTSHAQYTADNSSGSSSNWSQLKRSTPSPASEDYLGTDQSKPIAVCRYSSRRFGGQIRTDHKADLARNGFRNSLKKPSLGSLLSDNSPPSSSMAYNSLNADRCNVKPLLARKLQSTVPVGANTKELIGATVGYNGHIQLSNNSIGVNNSSLAAALKRPHAVDLLKNSAKQKNRRVKSSDGAINYVGNVVQLDPNSNKGQFPMVAVSLANGIANQQTIAIGNVVTANVRNSSSQSIRLHPHLVKDSQGVESRTTLGENIVIGSNLSGTGFLLADSSLKSLKQDGASGLRIEGSKIIATSKGTSVGNSAGPSINLVAATTTVAGATSTVLTQAVPHQGQYILTTVPGSANTQILQQLRNCRMGRSSGVKLLGTNAGTVTAGRPAFVLQQEKEAS